MNTDLIKNNHIIYFVIFILCLGNIFIYIKSFNINKVQNRSLDKDFPLNISFWASNEVLYDESAIAILDNDIVVYRTYKRDNKLPITLFIGYYGSSEKADLSHSPIVCFTGQGWDILASSHKYIFLDEEHNKNIEVNKLLQNNGRNYMITYYWYQSHDRAFSNRGFLKLYLLFNELFNRNCNNAFVRLTIAGSSEAQVNSFEKEMELFSKSLYPKLLAFLSE